MKKSAQSHSLPVALTTFGQKATTELQTFFETKRAALPAELSHAHTMLQDIEEFCLRGGKRLRPYLTYCGYTLFGGQEDKTIVAASIIPELIHAFLLIHDDIMDQDTERRGGPTIHALYERTTNNSHLGISLGILAGDLVYTLALEAVTSLPVTAAIKTKAMHLITETVSHTIYGQELDIWAEQHGEAIPVEQIARYKTAYYTFVLPINLGALLAGAKQTELSALNDYSIPCGIAFQLADDMLDGSVASATKQQAQDYSQKAKQALANLPPSARNATAKEALEAVADFVIDRDM